MSESEETCPYRTVHKVETQACADEIVLSEIKNQINDMVVEEKLNRWVLKLMPA